MDEWVDAEDFLKKVRYFRFCFWLVNVFFVPSPACCRVLYSSGTVVLMVVGAGSGKLGEGGSEEGKESSFRTFSTCVSGYMLTSVKPSIWVFGCVIIIIRYGYTDMFHPNSQKVITGTDKSVNSSVRPSVTRLTAMLCLSKNHPPPPPPPYPSLPSIISPPSIQHPVIPLYLT